MIKSRWLGRTNASKGREQVVTRKISYPQIAHHQEFIDNSTTIRSRFLQKFAAGKTICIYAQPVDLERNMKTKKARSSIVLYCKVALAHYSPFIFEEPSGPTREASPR